MSSRGAPGGGGASPHARPSVAWRHPLRLSGVALRTWRRRVTGPDPGWARRRRRALLEPEPEPRINAARRQIGNSRWRQANCVSGKAINPYPVLSGRVRNWESDALCGEEGARDSGCHKEAPVTHHHRCGVCVCVALETWLERSLVGNRLLVEAVVSLLFIPRART